MLFVRLEAKGGKATRSLRTAVFGGPIRYKVTVC